MSRLVLYIDENQSPGRRRVWKTFETGEPEESVTTAPVTAEDLVSWLAENFDGKELVVAVEKMDLS